MSDAINNGGSAFPGTNSDGMTLRDYFAAQSLVLYSSAECGDLISKRCRQAGLKEQDCLASMAYRLADAMLKARKP